MLFDISGVHQLTIGTLSDDRALEFGLIKCYIHIK